MKHAGKFHKNFEITTKVTLQGDHGGFGLLIVDIITKVLSQTHTVQTVYTKTQLSKDSIKPPWSPCSKVTFEQPLSLSLELTFGLHIHLTFWQWCEYIPTHACISPSSFPLLFLRMKEGIQVEIHKSSRLLAHCHGCQTVFPG